jgi:hypothetical protein
VVELDHLLVGGGLRRHHPGAVENLVLLGNQAAEHAAVDVAEVSLA